MGAFLGKNWMQNVGAILVVIYRLTWGAFLGTNLTLNIGGTFLCESLTFNRGPF